MVLSFIGEDDAWDNNQGNFVNRGCFSSGRHCLSLSLWLGGPKEQRRCWVLGKKPWMRVGPLISGVLFIIE